MALRLHLAPNALRALSECPAAVRETLQYELGAHFAAPLLHPAGCVPPGTSGTVVLHSGFHVRYRLELEHGLLHLLELLAPSTPPVALAG